MPVDGDRGDIEIFADVYGYGLDLDNEALHPAQLPITRRMAYYL